jgi:hypothetical protein
MFAISEPKLESCSAAAATVSTFVDASSAALETVPALCAVFSAFNFMLVATDQTSSRAP